MSFLPVEEAMAAIDQKVNLIGVVTEAGIPKLTRGTDCHCTLTLVDPSLATGISINFFEQTFEKLPQVASAGDIIQLSSVTVKRFNRTEVNAVFNKQYSSFALYEGKDGATFVPYQVSSKFRATGQDRHFISRMRNWATTHPPKTVPQSAAHTDALLLGNISRGSGINLICKVLHICEDREGGWMLFVWDGTDAPPLKVDSKLEEELKKPLHLQLEATPLSRDVLCNFPSVGTVLRMTVDPSERMRMGGFHTLKAAGKWVYFKNINIQFSSGLWCGVLIKDSMYSYLSDDDDLVLKYQRAHDERFKGLWTRIPLFSVPMHPPDKTVTVCSSLTETEHDHAPFVTLMDILTYPEVTQKYRCVVRVVSMLQCRPGSFRDPCSGVYAVRLTLEDPTARIYAYLYDKEADKFFGVSPSDDQMKMRNKLLGIEQGNESNPRKPPWTVCVLKSYYIDESDIWGSRRYGICRTKFKPELVG